jgi:predicted transcriptional regulator
MVSHVEALDPDERLETAVNKTVLHSDQSSFPVLSGGEFVGVVFVRDMQAVSDRWADLRVRDVMLSADRVPAVEANSDAGEALNELARRDPSPVAVKEEGHFVGFLRREDVVRWLSLHPRSAASSA